MPFRNGGNSPKVVAFDLEVLDSEPYFFGSWTEAATDPKRRVWSIHHLVAVHLGAASPNEQSSDDVIAAARRQLRPIAHVLRALNGPRFWLDWAIVSASEADLRTNNMILSNNDVETLRSGGFIIWWPSTLHAVKAGSVGRSHTTEAEHMIERALAIQLFRLDRLLTGAISRLLPNIWGTMVEAEVQLILAPELERWAEIRPRRGEAAEDRPAAIYRDYRKEMGPGCAAAHYAELSNRLGGPEIGPKWVMEGDAIGRRLAGNRRRPLRNAQEIASELRILQMLLVIYGSIVDFQKKVLPATRPTAKRRQFRARDEFVLDDQLTTTQTIELIETAYRFNIDVIEYFPKLPHLKCFADAARAIGVYSRTREFPYETAHQFYGMQGLLYQKGDACLPPEVVALRNRLRKGLPREGYAIAKGLPPGLLMDEDKLNIQAGAPDWRFTHQVVKWTTNIRNVG